MMSPWQFNVYIDGIMREMKARVGDVGLRIKESGWELSGPF